MQRPGMHGRRWRNRLGPHHPASGHHLPASVALTSHECALTDVRGVELLLRDRVRAPAVAGPGDAARPGARRSAGRGALATSRDGTLPAIRVSSSPARARVSHGR